MKIIKFSLFSLASLFFMVSCIQAQSVNGKGSKVTKEISVASFQSIGLGVQATVNIYKGSQKVTITGQENIINMIETKVKDGSWNISFPKNSRVRNYQSLTIDIYMPTVKNLSIGGSGDIIGHDSFNGLGDIAMSIGGSGTIEFKGSADSAKISIAGSGNVKASELSAGSCKVSIAGSGDAQVDVSGSLNVSIAGSGKVKYKGSPKIKTSIAGSGNISSME